MRALAALIVVVFVLMPGCTYFEGEEGIEENIVVEASDLSGKVVFTQEYTQGDVVGGNRILVKHNLAAGTYNLSAKHVDFSSAQTFVVTR